MFSKAEINMVQKVLAKQKSKKEKEIKHYQSTEYRPHVKNSDEQKKDEKEMQFFADAGKLLNTINNHYDDISKYLTSDDHNKLNSIKNLIEQLESLKSKSNLHFTYKMVLLPVGILGTALAMIGGVLTQSPNLIIFNIFSPEILIMVGLICAGSALIGYLMHLVGVHLTYTNEPAQKEIVTSGNFDLAIKTVKEMQGVISVAMTQADNPNLPKTGEEALKLRYELAPVYEYEDVLQRNPIHFLPKNEGPTPIMQAQDPLASLTPVYPHTT